MIPDRKPSSVGEILREEYFNPGELDVREFALACEVPNPATIQWLLSDAIFFRRAHAVALAKGTGTTPEFWLNINKGWRAWHLKCIESEIGQGPYPEWVKSIYIRHGVIRFSNGIGDVGDRVETVKSGLVAFVESTSLNLMYLVEDGVVTE